MAPHIVVSADDRMGDLGIQRLGIFQRRAYLSLSDLRLEISLVFAADLSEKLIDI